MPKGLLVQALPLAVSLSCLCARHFICCLVQPRIRPVLTEMNFDDWGVKNCQRGRGSKHCGEHRSSVGRGPDSE